MVTHNQTEHRANHTGVSCAHCHNALNGHGIAQSSTGDLCCSAACAAVLNQKTERVSLPPVICTNCETPCVSEPSIAFSEDGLPFCSAKCAESYPKPVSSPGVQRVLRSAAVFMFLSAAAVLLMIIENLSSISNPR